VPKPTPPPPPRPERRHPRFELLASVELHTGAETLILPARNLSLGGVFLGNDGHDLKRFRIGMTLEVLVFDGVDEEKPPVRSTAQVVRHQPDGMALMWQSDDPETALQLAQLLETLKPKPGAPAPKPKR
jgi:hypothetical protein